MTSPSRRPVFVIGCPRSGTTLLSVMLHSHPRIVIPPEMRFVLPAYAKRRSFGDLREERNRRELAEWITRRKRSKFHDLSLDPQDVTNEIVAGPPTLGSALGIVFRAYARRFGKPRWGIKRPAYTKNVAMLRRMWPDAQFIHLIRDPRDCVASLVEMPWYKRDAYHAMCAWREAIDHGRRYADRLGPDAYHEVRYENLTADPAAELKRLCDFLGEDYDTAMTDPRPVADVAVPERKSWHDRTRQAVTTARVGSWQDRLDPWAVSLTEVAAGDHLKTYGYEPSGAERPSLRQVERLHRVAAQRRMVRQRRAARDRWDRLREPNPVVSQLGASTTPTASAGADEALGVR